MFYVYILRSTKDLTELYYGYTINLTDRLNKHNTGEVSHTNKYKPWKIIFNASFHTKELALNFEKYLKTASGKAFMRKRLITPADE